MAETDFVQTLTARLDQACRTYGGQRLEAQPPAEVPADTFAAACDRLQPPPAATTAGVSLALAVGTSLLAVMLFESVLTDDTRPSAVDAPTQTKAAIVY